jgi:hypothetical protein
LTSFVYVCGINKKFMEDHILNLAGLLGKMTDKPAGQRLWNFFKGYSNNLTKAQCSEVIDVLEEEHKKTIKFIRENAKKCTS